MKYAKYFSMALCSFALIILIAGAASATTDISYGKNAKEIRYNYYDGAVHKTVIYTRCNNCDGYGRNYYSSNKYRSYSPYYKKAHSYSRGYSRGYDRGYSTGYRNGYGDGYYDGSYRNYGYYN